MRNIRRNRICYAQVQNGDNYQGHIQKALLDNYVSPKPTNYYSTKVNTAKPKPLVSNNVNDR